MTERDIGWKSPIFRPTWIWRPRWADSTGITPRCLASGTTVRRLPCNHDYVTVSWVVLSQYQGVTDGWTDRQTDRTAISVSCSAWLCHAYAQWSTKIHKAQLTANVPYSSLDHSIMSIWSCLTNKFFISCRWQTRATRCITAKGNIYKNSSGDEIANVNFFTTTSYMHSPAPTPIEPTT